MVEATLTQENLGELHGRLSRCFARVEPLQQARKYVTGLMSDDVLWCPLASRRLRGGCHSVGHSPAHD